MKLDKAPGGGRSDAEELLLRVAWFYYKDELTQEEIARRLSVSRASVGRMLDRARKVGLVSINLNADHLNAFEVSSQLRRTFGLSEALVVPDHRAEPTDHHVLNARLGIGGARFMSTHLRPGGTLGVGWGETASRVIAGTNFGAVGPVHLVTLTGGVDGYLQTILSSKGESAAEPEATTATIIPSPIVASSPQLAAALRAEPTIQRVLQQARDVEQAVVGVGTPTADATIVQMGSSPPTMSGSCAAGAWWATSSASSSTPAATWSACRSTSAGSGSSCPTWPGSPRWSASLAACTRPRPSWARCAAAS